MLGLALILLAQASPAPAETAEIVVTARRDKCRVQFADRTLSDREFAARAKDWSRGTVVRVVAPRGADYKCLAKISFRLGRYGVRLIEFVDRPATS